MKLNKNYVQTFVFILVYLFAVYFWSQPYQERRLPYGEYDAMSHFEVGDYMAYNDKSIFYLPPYIDLRYGMDNKFKPHTLWYPPPFHTALGIMEVIGGERVLPIFLLNALMSTFIIITTYFVIASLFGFLPAILSALLLIFSPRDFMPYLWGQWPERFAYAFVPVALYCFYKYFMSFSKESIHESGHNSGHYSNSNSDSKHDSRQDSKHDRRSSKPIYLYLAALFLGVTLLIHPLVFFHSAFAIITLYAILSVKQKKFVFSWKHMALALLIFLAVFMSFPYQTFNIFPQLIKKTPTQAVEENKKEAAKNIDLSRLFGWSLNPKDYAGSVPPSYFSFSEMHGLWTLPFLLIGLLFLFWRGEERDLFLLAWIISLYLVLHRDIIGKASFLHRSLSASAHIFAPITAIGAVYLASFVKLPSNLNKYAKYVIAVIFVYLVFSINMAYALKNAPAPLNKDTYSPATQYGFFVTLNQEEYQAAQWILENVPASANITVLGIPHAEQFLSATSKKIRWFAAVSQHVTRFYYLRENREEILKSADWYFMLDYSMLEALNDKKTFENMQEFEKNKLKSHKLLYDKNKIRIYKLEGV